MSKHALYAILATTLGCGGGIIVRDKWEVGDYTPTQLRQENGGVKVTFKPAARDETELVGEVQACDPRTGLPAVYRDGEGPTLRDNGKPIIEAVALAPKETWWVKVTIENNTDHIVRLDRSVVKLMDPAGNAHELLSKDEVEALLMAARPCSTTANLLPRLALIKLFTRQIELLPSTSYTAWLAFNPKVENLIAGTWKTVLYEVPVETDPAGNVIKTTRFELPTAIRHYRETYKSGGMFGSDAFVSREEVP